MGKKKLSVREEKHIGEVSAQLVESKAIVRKNSKTTLLKPPHYMLGAYSESEENPYCSQMNICVFFENDPYCRWLRENRCSSKCKVRTGSNRSIGVDGDKIRYRPDKAEEKLRTQVCKTLKRAQALEDVIHKQEVSKAASERLKKMNALMWGLKSLLKDDQSDEIMTEKEPPIRKYTHIKSLV